MKFHRIFLKISKRCVSSEVSQYSVSNRVSDVVKDENIRAEIKAATAKDKVCPLEVKAKVML